MSVTASDLEIVILAAGKGTRMGGDNPKVLADVAGRPMLSYLLDAAAEAHAKKPVIVIGYQAEKVREVMGSDHRYVIQADQLGTGHAVKVALSEILPDVKYVIVLNGDHPLVDAATIRALYSAHLKQARVGMGSIEHDADGLRGSHPLTICTIKLPDFNDWRAPFYDFGRIVRDEKGLIKKIVEKNDATEEEKLITEVNPAYYCFDAAWLRDRIKQIDSANPKGEFYITSLIGIAQKEGAVLNSIEIPEHQGLGVNTPDQLKIALKFINAPREKLVNQN